MSTGSTLMEVLTELLSCKVLKVVSMFKSGDAICSSISKQNCVFGMFSYFFQVEFNIALIELHYNRLAVTAAGYTFLGTA